jgi:tryptophan-rich sensory protein
MNELASKAQLRMSYMRWALFSITLILFFGMASGYMANSGYGNHWFSALAKPAFTPPGWVFAAVWPTLYVLLGLAVALIIDARGAAGRGLALLLFIVQLLGNFAWSPLFFAAHEISLALYLLVAILALSLLAAGLFSRIRPLAALLMLPYLLWLGFALYLNYGIDKLNPDGETLVAPAINTQI